ncbi:MAG: threonine ammonia-lyase [Deltaproteobacteria bacterium]|nr:threonine ammonia-lyase [Deltaproteobacteria bacterium]
MIPFKNIVNASKIINGKVIRTPLVHSPTLSRMFGGKIYLKLENLQKTGSFKIRGATYKIQTRLKEIGSGGVVAASAGNHAQGVALAAAQAGIQSTIVMPEWVSISKQEATRNYGGEVHIEGETLAASLEIAKELAGNKMSFIHPFDDGDIITGQGTIALEILEDLNDTDMIIAPIGGGGLISGIASAARSIKPDIKIIGVQSASCPSAYESIKKGEILMVDSQSSIADGISVKQLGRLNFEIIQKYIDEVVLVEEKHIALAILTLLERKKILAEGAGAVSLAALMNGAVKISGDEKVVLIISDGNVDSPLLGRIISHGLAKNGRIMRFLVKLDDTPGALSSLLKLIASLKVNVLDIHHDRYIKDAPLYVSYVELELETRSHSHIDEIFRELETRGYDIELK